ncbi:MAG: hypothetical protein ACOXZ4_02090 [Sphaerochaetaceae bacterium]
MKPSNLWRSLAVNWPVKVFSLLLAVGVFVIINYTSVDQREVEIPLQVVLPAGYSATSTVPSSVLLTIQAEGRYLAMINPSAVTAVADFSSVNDEGVAGTPVKLNLGPSLFEIEATYSLKPEVVRIYFVRDEAVSL